MKLKKSVFDGTGKNYLPGGNKKASVIQFFKFCIVGLSNTLIAYAVYAGLVYVNIHYFIANAIAFVISVFNSFYWNNKYTFKANKKAKGRKIIKIFLLALFTSLFLQNTLLFLLIEFLQISKYFAPFFCLVVTVPLNFVLMKMWVFK